MNLIKAMATVGGLTGISRVLGFIRDILTAAILGAGPIADAFFIALKLPNFFRRVTAEGAFSVSFVPLYSKTLEVEGQEVADSFAMNMFYIMLCCLGIISLLVMWAMPFVIYAIAPGFAGDELRYDLAVDLARVTFPYLLLMSLTALLGGVLNARGKFAPFAFAPVLFNISLILALLFSGMAQSAGHAMAYGVLFAGFAQLAWLAMSARRAGVHFKAMRPRLDAKATKVFRLMGPGVVGAGVMHINLFADMIIASFLATGSISYLYYADRLNQLPLGVVGIAVGTALLPLLSKALAAGDKEKANDLFNRSMEYCFLLALPAALALMMFGALIVSTLFERGAFDAKDAAITAQVLTLYAIGLPAYIAVKVFSTLHWASEDTKTPVRIAIIGTSVNIALSIMLVGSLGVAGIAMATGLTGWLQVAMHWNAVQARGMVSFDDRLRFAFPRIVGSSLLMVFLTGAFYALLSGFAPNLHQIIMLGFVVCFGMVTYGLSVILSGVIKAPKGVTSLISSILRRINF